MDIIKIAALGLAGTWLGIMLKGQKKEYELFISMGACLCILYFIITKLEIVLSVINQMQNYVKIDAGYVGLLFKMIGITYIAEFSANLCKDAGYRAVAGQMEMFGKLSILAISMPVLLVLLETVGEFLT